MFQILDNFLINTILRRIRTVNIVIYLLTVLK